ncbi:excinuclease ABC subunit UvrC [Corynebacterium heidelbergense]|uniref:UvrABC system protein C n=1 Tax=Corynebacterium heidelbergense TaxID=2055947 RepID=A0A364VBH5_9CORY|nr:excinuclease ABC subunit UvrC [Corynebacterium heidelbergense]RAV34005.1 excinuclease ABC subunit UvrC [Corynebacterium heidelbergense]
MSRRATFRPAPGTIPTEPGVYTFRDASDRVIYVGKAKNLRSRLSNYFQDYSQLHPRTRAMVQSAAAVRWTVVASELEALNLEYTWIKRFNPRFNVMYRDDKTYPMLAISVKEEIPRAFLYRGPRRKGVRYYGPYPKAWAIRETLESLTRVFPIRTCSAGVYRRHEALGRPCLLGYIDRCSAPCVGTVSPAEHRELVDQFSSFLAGNTEPVLRRVRREMEVASENLDFERAASLRDQLGAMTKAMEKQAVVFSDATDADLVGLVTDELEAAVQIFHVRGGRIHGQRGWVVERDDVADSTVIANFLTQFYGEEAELATATETAVGGASSPGVDRSLARVMNPATVTALGDLVGDKQVTPVPREILVPTIPDDADRLGEWLSGLRGAAVNIRVPQRGDKKALMETAQSNAQQALKQHKLKRTGDITARSAALHELQEALWLDSSPLRIECIDVSHIQGTDVVASLVVFEDGLPKKSDYRRYKIRQAAGEGLSSAPPKRAFAYPPQLFVVDGGKPQVAAAQAVLEELGVTDVALVGIAKRLEELWLPGEDYPVIVARNSPALYLIQNLRDEAHRFAITFHRQQRSARMRRSALDDISGLGPKRRKQLVSQFGSVARIKQASVADIAEVEGFGPALAEAVYAALHRKEGLE